MLTGAFTSKLALQTLSMFRMTRPMPAVTAAMAALGCATIVIGSSNLRAKKSATVAGLIASSAIALLRMIVGVLLLCQRRPFATLGRRRRVRNVLARDVIHRRSAREKGIDCARGASSAGAGLRRLASARRS